MDTGVLVAGTRRRALPALWRQGQAGWLDPTAATTDIYGARPCVHDRIPVSISQEGQSAPELADARANLGFTGVLITVFSEYYLAFTTGTNATLVKRTTRRPRKSTNARRPSMRGTPPAWNAFQTMSQKSSPSF